MPVEFGSLGAFFSSDCLSFFNINLAVINKQLERVSIHVVIVTLTTVLLTRWQ